MKLMRRKKPHKIDENIKTGSSAKLFAIITQLLYFIQKTSKKRINPISTFSRNLPRWSKNQFKFSFFLNIFWVGHALCRLSYQFFFFKKCIRDARYRPQFRVAYLKIWMVDSLDLRDPLRHFTGLASSKIAFPRMCTKNYKNNYSSAPTIIFYLNSNVSNEYLP